MAQINTGSFRLVGAQPKAEDSRPTIRYDELASGRMAARIYNYTKSEMDAITNWCRETECGKVVNPWTIAFRNDGEKMMFMLKWQ